MLHALIHFTVSVASRDAKLQPESWQLNTLSTEVFRAGLNSNISFGVFYSRSRSIHDLMSLRNQNIYVTLRKVMQGD